MSRRGKQADHRADTRGSGFVGVPMVVISSPAYRSLSAFARALLIELLARFNGYNNGSIAVSQRQIAEAMSTTNFRRIGAATAELMDRGLIDVATEGAWKARQARLYRITFISTGKAPNPRPAGNEYLNWKSGADDVSAGKPILADHPSAERRNPADHPSARLNGKRRKSVNLSNFAADHPSALIGNPYLSPKEREGLPDRSAAAINSGPPLAAAADVEALRIDVMARCPVDDPEWLEWLSSESTVDPRYIRLWLDRRLDDAEPMEAVTYGDLVGALRPAAPR